MPASPRGSRWSFFASIQRMAPRPGVGPGPASTAEVNRDQAMYPGNLLVEKIARPVGSALPSRKRIWDETNVLEPAEYKQRHGPGPSPLAGWPIWKDRRART